jgi:DNA mismatch endonuclease, patch repair protein
MPVILSLSKDKTVIFIHGCFCYGDNNCRYFVVPKTRTNWWLNKINTNKANDLKAIKSLKKRKLENYDCMGMPVKTGEG